MRPCLKPNQTTKAVYCLRGVTTSRKMANIKTLPPWPGASPLPPVMPALACLLSWSHFSNLFVVSLSSPGLQVFAWWLHGTINHQSAILFDCVSKWALNNEGNSALDGGKRPRESTHIGKNRESVRLKEKRVFGQTLLLPVKAANQEAEAGLV